MIDKRDYARCFLYGDGEFITKDKNQSIRFEVIDISASGAKISTKADFQLNSNIKIKILIPDGQGMKRFIIESTILRKQTGLKNVYAINFIDLSEYSKIELDELFKKIISKQLLFDLQFCEDGKQLFNRNKRRTRYAIH